jgi:hypothetical protein
MYTKTQLTFCYQCVVRGCMNRVTRSAFFTRTKTVVGCCEDHDPNRLGFGGPLPRVTGYVAEAPAVSDLWLPDYVPAVPAALGTRPDAPTDAAPGGPSGGQRVRRPNPKPTLPGGGGAAVPVASNVRLVATR